MKIKLLPLLILVLGFSVPALFAQTDKAVAEIRSEVNSINKNMKKYTKKTKDVEDISLEGTEAAFYVSGKDLKKISAKMYGETYNASAELYYKSDELIFAFYKLNRYDTQIGSEKSPKVVESEEKRLYFAGGKMIKILVGKINVKDGSKQWEESEKDIVELAGKLRAAFRN